MHLAAARMLLDAGDRLKAAEEVDAALAIDSDFLAAQLLREEIAASTRNARSAPNRVPALPGEESVGPAPAFFGVSATGYAQFENRARRRRVDRCLDAARTAIARGRLREASSALAEVTELDPNLPELREVSAALDQLRRGQVTSHRGQWLVAAAAFGAIVLGTPLHEAVSLRLRPTGATLPQGTPAEALDPGPTRAPEGSVAAKEAVAPRATSGDLPEASPTTSLGVQAAVDRRPLTDEPAPAESGRREEAHVLAPRGADARPTEPQNIPATAVDLAVVATELPVTALAGAPPRRVATDSHPADSPRPDPVAPAVAIREAAPLATASLGESSRPPDRTSPPPAHDEDLVKATLQRFRHAYEGLDAHSAQAIWPTVNEAALARAFGGLRSQSLTFEACDVHLDGDAAAATCRGSARYVPKIGSREPQIEARTWNFSLRRNGSDWTIQSARASASR